MNVNWTLPALQDLDDIEEFIALDDYNAAVAFVDQLIDLGESLGDPKTAKKGTPVSWSNDQSVRELYYKGYTIVYELRDLDNVDIHEVYNQKRIHLRYGFRNHH